jgi:N4-(beta-N-acetylglucosaminyl)-L-asparaginase
MELNNQGVYLLDAIVAGIKIVEDDPNDDSVGYGGLPNEEGVVQLDSSIMDGPTHRAGSVGALENIKNPAAVALLVLRRTGHVMLVGAGALKFAKQMGFQEENLLTEKSRQEWLKWKGSLNKEDWWLDEDQQIKAPSGPTKSQSALDVHYTSGTVHCSGLDSSGRMGACTSTSGLSWKLPGRLGDSPIVGAGMYCDNEIGSAGATGRGESVIQVCGSFSVVQHMAAGKSPTEACLAVLQKIADKTKEKRLLDEKGQPKFNVTFYALRKDGAYGSACMLPGGTYAVHDGTGNRVAKSVPLFGSP